MKKLILGIIAVFIIEIGFITYLQLNSNEGPTTAAVDDKIVAPVASLRHVEEQNDVPPTKEVVPEHDSSTPEFRRTKFKALRTPPVRAAARRAHPRLHPTRSLSARAFNQKPRIRVSPRPGYHVEVQREYFGNMVIEVSYRVYNFRPRVSAKSRKGQILA